MGSFPVLEEDALLRWKGVLPKGGVVAFHLTGADAGAWQINERGTLVTRVTGVPCDCIIRCDSELLRRIVSGERSAREAFFRGELLIEGDIGIAMRLERAAVDAA